MSDLWCPGAKIYQILEPAGAEGLQHSFAPLEWRSKIMRTEKNSGILKALTALTFILMVGVNGLANALPINGLQTGQVCSSASLRCFEIGMQPTGWS